MVAEPTLSSRCLLELRNRTEYAYKSGDWRELPIQENHESLVQVPEDMTCPFYADVMQLTNDRRIYLRQSVLDMVMEARQQLWLDVGLELKVLDGWRSVEVQQALFWYYMKEFTVPKFHLQETFEKAVRPAEVIDAFNQLPPGLQKELNLSNLPYVSWPSADPQRPSPHATGGAVDVWVYQGTEQATLGIPFDWMEDNAGAFYHLRSDRTPFDGDDTQACQNRNALLNAMDSAGFSCYPAEIWHFNFGNQMDMLATGRPARYSYIEP